MEKLSIPSYEPAEDNSVAFNVVSSSGSVVSSSIPSPPRGILRNSNLNYNANDDNEYFFKAALPNQFAKGGPGSVDSGNENDDETTDTSDSQKILKVMVDRRMSVNKLKLKLQPFIKIPMEYFKIFHVLASQTENECLQLNATLNSEFKDEERLLIELGRALRKGECKVKLYYLNTAEVTDLEKLPFVCDYILRESAEVGQTKREILAHIRALDEKYANMTFERSRLRKKGWKSPAQIYIEDQKFGDDYMIKSSTSPDIVIQELATEDAAVMDVAGHPITYDTKSFFIRRFYPSKLELGPWDEILFGKKCEMKETLAKLSGIDVDNVVYTK